MNFHVQQSLHSFQIEVEVQSAGESVSSQMTKSHMINN